MTQGIIYVNSAVEDRFYVKEAEASAASFRRFIPDAEYVLYTDAEAFSSPAFDRIEIARFAIPEGLEGTDHKGGQMVAKHAALAASPFGRTLYLGSDTYALKSQVSTLFSLLDRFDLAAAHAPHRINTSWGNSPIDEVPPSFPEFNCDLILFRSSPIVFEFLARWRELYLENAFGHPHDQGAFRYLAYTSDLRIATLPPEYNYRGQGFRSNTVVLQNRDELHRYLRRAPADGSKARRRVTVLIRRILHKMGRCFGIEGY